MRRTALVMLDRRTGEPAFDLLIYGRSGSDFAYGRCADVLASVARRYPEHEVQK